jgi:NAD(P)H-flavin reductase
MFSARILEIFLDDRRAAARIACASTLIPAPGQYLLAHDPASDDPLAVPVFSAGTCPEGFLAASPLPRTWSPGVTLSLRGPLGRGFILPPSARRVALAALDVSPAYLLGLIPPAHAQGAAISLVCADPPDDLPDDVEIRPLAALAEVCQWADYLALAATRASLRGWRERLRNGEPLIVLREAQALVVTPMPCGGLAKCGVCSVEVKGGMKPACEDGPVFDLI